MFVQKQYLLSKFKLIVALLSPSSFLAVTLYLPASSTVTLLISSEAWYDLPSLLTVSWNIEKSRISFDFCRKK